MHQVVFLIAALPANHQSADQSRGAITPAARHNPPPGPGTTPPGSLRGKLPDARSFQVFAPGRPDRQYPPP